MEIKSMLGAIVSVILVMAVVVPIISGLGTVTGDFDNQTEFYFTKATLEETPDFTITYDSNTGGATYTEGSTTLAIPRTVGLPLAFSIDDNKGFKFPTASSSNKLAVVTPVGLFSDVTEIKVESGAMTYTRSGGSPTNFTITGELWHITKDADMGAYQTFETNTDSEVYSFNVINVLENNLRLYTEGTAAAQTTAYAYSSTSSTEVTDTTTLALNYTVSNGGSLYVTGGTITIGDNSEERTDLWFIAPVQYQGQAVSENGIVNTLVGIIPVLLIVGVVIGIVASMLWRRD